MAAMNNAYLNAIASHGAGLITHIALVDSTGTEVGDARQPVTWTSPSDGLIRPTSDLEFQMDAGDEVAGWRGFDSLTGGTGYGGATLSTVSFGNPGTYTLLANQSGIDHNAA